MFTCGLTSCTQGSAPGPTLGIECGKAFTFTFFIKSILEQYIKLLEHERTTVVDLRE